MANRAVSFRIVWLWVWLSATCTLLTAQSPVIDFNPDNGRGDVLTLGAFNWPVGTAESIQQTIGDITVRVVAEGSDDAKLTFAWWKAGYDFGATRVSDGVTTLAANQNMRLVITGLKPGKHSLTTWHNHVDADPPVGKLSIDHAGLSIMVEPSHRVTHDDEARTAHLTFEQTADETLEVVLRPAQGQRVILNSLASIKSILRCKSGDQRRQMEMSTRWKTQPWLGNRP